MENPRPGLEEVFHPRGIAVVGASPSQKLAFATRVVSSLKEAGFPNIYPVNPNCSELFGLPCYPSIRDIQGPIDHVVVAIPAASVLAVLDDCAAKGAKSVHFFTAGFRESGGQAGAELEKAMLARAKQGGFRIIGPNCVGFYVPAGRVLNGISLPVETGPIAFVSQSGGHAHGLPYFGVPRGLRFSKVVSYGNALDVDESELLEYLADDPETQMVAAYIEGVKDGDRFKKVLKRLAESKPTVIYKGGATEAGIRAARSHTASLAGSPEVFRALCRQYNVVQVGDIDEMIDTLVALRFVQPVPRGRGICTFGIGGGLGVLAGDEIERAGLTLPRLPQDIQAELRTFLSIPGGIFENPIDAQNLLTPNVVQRAMMAVGKAAGVHMLLYHLGFHTVSRWGDGRFSSVSFLGPLIDGFKQVQTATGRPVMVALKPPPDSPGMRDFLEAQRAFVEAGLPVFHSMKDAALAVARVLSWQSGHGL